MTRLSACDNPIGPSLIVSSSRRAVAVAGLPAEQPKSMIATYEVARYSETTLLQTSRNGRLLCGRNTCTIEQFSSFVPTQHYWKSNRIVSGFRQSIHENRRR